MAAHQAGSATVAKLVGTDGFDRAKQSAEVGVSGNFQVFFDVDRKQAGGVSKPGNLVILMEGQRVAIVVHGAKRMA